MDFEERRKQAAKVLATASTESIENELRNRQSTKNPFPLEVFNDKIKPFIQNVHQHYNIPKSFIGLTLLTTYSTAIGNAYWLQNKRLGSMPLTVWSCLLGVTSSGKSLCQKVMMFPLNRIQEELSFEWDQLTADMSHEERQHQQLKKLLFQDIVLATLTRSVLPDNPKGMLKDSDEILEWINGMNPNNRKEGNEEQFWLKCWDGSAHQLTRSGKDEVYLKKMFIAQFGGIQPTVLYKLFKNDRDTTGFIFRFLFTESENFVPLPDIMFEMPTELEAIHERSVRKMYDVKVYDHESIRLCRFDHGAIHEFNEWRKMLHADVNNTLDLDERNLKAGIFGKMVTYAQRFAAILHLSDIAYDDGRVFRNEEWIDHLTMSRAIKLADYFYNAARNAHELSKRTERMPEEVSRLAILFTNGFSYEQIGVRMWPDLPPKTSKARAYRMVKKYITKYPERFRATTSSRS